MHAMHLGDNKPKNVRPGTKSSDQFQSENWESEECRFDEGNQVAKLTLYQILNKLEVK